jgi:hypothetical protein
MSYCKNLLHVEFSLVHHVEFPFVHHVENSISTLPTKDALIHRVQYHARPGLNTGFKQDTRAGAE